MGTTQVHVRQFFVSLFSHHFPGLVMGTTQVYVLLILVYYSTGHPTCRINNLRCIIVHFYFTLTNYCSFGDDLSAQKKSCTVANNNHSKQDLGSQKPTLSFQEQCEGSGCCWRPVSSTEKVFQRNMSFPRSTLCVLFLLTMTVYHFLIKIALYQKLNHIVQLRTPHGATTLVVMVLDLEETATM